MQVRLPHLSPRETQICRLAGLGYTSKAIGCELGITQGTVASYWRRIFFKLACRSRTQAAVLVAVGSVS
jgi:DNA-binding CsgD family transcriptional regulator